MTPSNTARIAGAVAAGLGAVLLWTSYHGAGFVAAVAGLTILGLGAVIIGTTMQRERNGH